MLVGVDVFVGVDVLVGVFVAVAVLVGVGVFVGVGVRPSPQLMLLVLVVQDVPSGSGSGSLAITPSTPPPFSKNGCVTGKENVSVPLPLSPAMLSDDSFDSTVAM